jgi:glutathione S-transferase
MLTLFHAPGSASSRILWLLEELEADYELVQVAAGPGPDGTKDARNPHPHGYAPALVHDGELVYESGAIVLHLTDLHPEAGLAPAVGEPGRAAFLTWLFFQVGVAEPLIYMKAKGSLEGDPAMTGLYEAMLARVDAALTAHPYLLGEQFSAVDVLFMSLFEQARPLLPPSTVRDAYLARAARSARQQAQARDAALSAG